MKTKTILVTGSAGFIGYHLCESLVNSGFNVVGLDNINSYYDINLKYDRLNNLGIQREAAEIFGIISSSIIFGTKMQFIRMNIEDRKLLPELFEKIKFDLVCNLGAQAGVRYSINNPNVYIDSNIAGFLNILECCRNYNIKRLVYASSSSVYGNSKKVPFEEEDDVNEPISLYAATKKSNELMAFTYSHLYDFETIGLRFFTVYGPWGRPDMAMFLFTDAIIKGNPIKIFNSGDLSRDFTYVGDIVDGVTKTLLLNSKGTCKSEIYNIGNNKPVKLLAFIETIEQIVGKTAIKEMVEMQPGDVNRTWANTQKLEKDFGYKSTTSINEGIKKFVNWYAEYYKIEL
jgi:UDP-glucuronate 4-epimerase